jgi:hypothetical protein
MESESLKTSSQRWMGASLAAFTEGPAEHDFAVHHAAVAVEHIMKAYLASLHPVLIIDVSVKSPLASLLHATGHGHLIRTPVTENKTISIHKAREYVWRILGEKFRITDNELKPLAEARNGVAHAAVHEADGIPGLLTLAMRCIDPLLNELRIDPEEYWGPYRDLHDRMVDERVEAVRVSLAVKIARARNVFTQRFGHLNEEERRMAILRATTRSWPYFEKLENRPCPACDVQGVVVGDTLVGTANGEPVVLFVPALYDCPICDLELSGEELQEVAELAEPIVVDDDLSNYIYSEEGDVIRRR